MGISDKEAFRILELPLGVDKDAIRDRYKLMSSKLSASKLPEDKKRLEHVVAAYSQLLPPPLVKHNNHANNNNNKNNKNSGNNRNLEHYRNDSDDSSSEDNSVKASCRNGISRSHNREEIMDAERDSKKAEKRRAKKKKRKEKKKLEKIESKYSGVGNFIKEDDSDSEEEEENMEDEQQGFDPKSAFVAMVGKKISSNLQPDRQEENKRNINKGNNQEEMENNAIAATDIESRILQSRKLAIRGNEEANHGQYDRAVRLFSEAIRLDPNDHRFFGNRSYCYDQLGQYEKALKDADRATKIANEWPKGHFRRGRALKGLERYLDAEAAFQQVLKFDQGCEDALTEIIRVRKKRIVEMGFTEQQARAAIKKYSYVQPALDALLAREFQDTIDNNVFYSDEEEVQEEPPRPAVSQPASNVKMNPRNPEGLTSLWVGNVVPEVSEKMLTKAFAKHGQVTSVRLLKEKYCAFVNFSDKVGAGRAMAGLQGYDLSGSKLLIKFPDNPIVNGTANVVIRKNKSVVTKTSSPPAAAAVGSIATVSSNASSSQNMNTVQSQVASNSNNASNGNNPKARGPVNGDECYFWRTSGCAFGDACKHKHIPSHKGIDKKPWQK